MASRCSPDWQAVTLAGVILNLVGEVGDQLGSLCKVGPPDGIGMQTFLECPVAKAADLGRPSCLVGEPRDEPVGLVELCHGLRSGELFGCDVEAVDVALDRLEEPGRWVVELAQDGAGEDGRFIAAEDLLPRHGWRAQ
jgi:hypothetical protein